MNEKINFVMLYKRLLLRMFFYSFDTPVSLGFFDEEKFSDLFLAKTEF